MSLYTIKSPITSAPTRRKYLKTKAWDDYKELMISKRRKGKTAEQIRRSLRKRGFNAGIASIKARLSNWEPKNSSYRRKGRSRVTVPGDNTDAAPEPDEDIEMAICDNVDEDLEISNLMDVDSHHDREHTAGEEVMVDAAIPESDSPETRTADEPCTQEPKLADEQQKDTEKAKLIDIANNILSTVGVGITQGGVDDLELPSFDQWEAQQGQDCLSGNRSSPKSGKGEDYKQISFDELLRMAKDMGRPGWPYLQDMPVIVEISDDAEYSPGESESLSNAMGGTEKDIEDERETGDSNEESDPKPEFTHGNEEGLGNKRADEFATLREARRLIDQADLNYQENRFLEAFTAARDAYTMLKKISPFHYHLLGRALYEMGHAFRNLTSGQRLHQDIQIFTAAYRNFSLAGSVHWEISCLYSILRDFRVLGDDDNARPIALRILDRIKILQCLPFLLRIPPSQEMWVACSEAIRFFASQISYRISYKITRALVNCATSMYGRKHRITLGLIQELVSIISHSARGEDALAWAHYGYNVALSMYGSCHETLLYFAVEVHRSLIKMKRFDDALVVYRGIAATKPAWQKWDPVCMKNIAEMLIGLRDHFHALKMLQMALAGMKRMFKENDYTILQTEKLIIQALYERGLILYAQPIAEYYMTRCEKRYGKSHPRTLDAILLNLRCRLGIEYTPSFASR